MHTFAQLLDRARGLHHRLCPRQVLGIRIGLLAGQLLGLELPQREKRLFVFMETDGCAADGVGVATGCTVGHRTMRIVDFGKVAATFVDTATARAIRIHPHPDSRKRATALLPQARSSWQAQLEGYQSLPDEELLIAEPVSLLVNLDALLSRPGIRVICSACGEEVMNEREVRRGEKTLCRACDGEGYYRTTAPARATSTR